MERRSRMTHFSSENVVHDAGAILIILESRQKRLDGGGGVGRVQLANLHE